MVTLPESRATVSVAKAALKGSLAEMRRNCKQFDDAVGLFEQARDADIPIRINYWNSPRHHLERIRSRDAQASIEIAASFVSERLRLTAQI